MYSDGGARFVEAPSSILEAVGTHYRQYVLPPITEVLAECAPVMERQRRELATLTTVIRPFVQRQHEESARVATLLASFFDRQYDATRVASLLGPFNPQEVRESLVAIVARISVETTLPSPPEPFIDDATEPRTTSIDLASVLAPLPPAVAARVLIYGMAVGILATMAFRDPHLFAQYFAAAVVSLGASLGGNDLS